MVARRAEESGIDMGGEEPKIFCSRCQAVTAHRHLHRTAHGLPGTHMSGSERYQCWVCGWALFKNDPGAGDLRFVLD